MTMRCTS